MKRLIEKIVFCGFVTCWRFAGAPTSRWSSFVNATTDGVVRPPSAFGITVGSPPSITAMHELVVPRSIPITFAIVSPSPLRSKTCYRIKSKPLYVKLRRGYEAGSRIRSRADCRGGGEDRRDGRPEDGRLEGRSRHRRPGERARGAAGRAGRGRLTVF